MPTKIEWTHVPDGAGGFKTGETWNPQVGCREVSPGCRECYAAKQAHLHAKTIKQHAGLTVMRTNAAGENLGAHWNGQINRVPHLLAQPLRWRDPRGIFVCSMSDLFFDVDSDDACRWIAAIFGVMAACPQHTFMVLTKRPENAERWFASPGIADLVRTFKHVALSGRIEEVFAEERVEPIAGWPGYFITSKGRVLSDRTNAGTRGSDLHELALMPNDQGHSRVMLYGGSEPERFLVHRLVLTAFDRSAAVGEQCCHIDGNAKNNALWNLRWGSQASNWEDRKRHGHRRSYAKLSIEQAEEIRRRWSGGPTTKALAEEFGVSDTQIRNIGSGRHWGPEPVFTWPLPGVWVGVTAEDQRRADERVPVLLGLPAAVRFVSYEPALGPVDWTRINWPGRWPVDVLRGGSWDIDLAAGFVQHSDMATLDWLICGGESGPKARPMHPDWARSARDQCEAAGTAFFFKQWGEWAPLIGALADAGDNPEISRFDHREWNGDGWSNALRPTWVDFEDGHVDAEQCVARIGKAAAGRELDGRTHDAFPGAR